jgi:hypothetical protein
MLPVTPFTIIPYQVLNEVRRMTARLVRITVPYQVANGVTAKACLVRIFQIQASADIELG